MGWRVDRCCCFHSSKDAAFASGTYTAIVTLFGIISHSLLFSYRNDPRGYADFGYAVLVSTLTFLVLFFAFSALLLYAVVKECRLALIPWMVWMIIVVVAQCAGIVLVVAVCIQTGATHLLLSLAVGVPLLSLNIICFLAVKTHYHSLRSTKAVDAESPKYQKF